MYAHTYTYVHNVHVNGRCRRKQARSYKQQGKATQHSTPKAVTFPKKNELPQVGLEPTTLYTLDMYIHVLIRDEKEERSKQGHTNNKAKQHNTPKAVTSPKKNELPQVGFEPTTPRTLDRML